MARVADFLNRRYDDSPKERIGIGGFTALVRIEEKTTQTADIPATVVEDGSFVNDHIILNQLVLSIQGDVSDVFVEPSPIIQDLKRTQAEVGAITQYAPTRTQFQVQQINALTNDISDVIRKADALLGAGEQALKFFGNQGEAGKTNQERFIDSMDALHYGKQLIAIDMPYRRYDNMVITSLEVTRDNERKALRFSLEAREFRFADVVFTEIESAPAPSFALGGQAQPETSKGVQSGADIDASILFTVKSWFF